MDDVHPILFDILPKHLFAVEYLPEIAPSQIADALQYKQVLVVRSKVQVNADLLHAISTLEVVARVGAGTDNLDEQYLRQRGITILNAPEGNCDSVAEHTLGLLLNVLHKISYAHQQVTKYNWPREAARGTELKGKVVGIIGYGNMGKALAIRLTGFGCKVLFYDRNDTVVSDCYADSVPLANLLRDSDVVSIHIPLTPENKYWVNEAFFEKVCKSIVLLNTSRGEIVEPFALQHAVETGKVSALGLDVLPNEKLDNLTPMESDWFKWLISRNNVVVTPHVAGWSLESYERLSVVIGKKLIDMYQNN